MPTLRELALTLRLPEVVAHLNRRRVLGCADWHIHLDPSQNDRPQLFAGSVPLTGEAEGPRTWRYRMSPQQARLCLAKLLEDEVRAASSKLPTETTNEELDTLTRPYPSRPATNEDQS